MRNVLTYWIVAQLAFLMTSCVSPSSNERWYNPTTWRSASEASKVDRIEEKVNDATSKAIKAAQKASHEAGIALGAAEQTKPVKIASTATEMASQLLDQVSGPLTVDQLASIRQEVALLLSDNQQLREEGERLQEANRLQVEKLSKDLNKLQVNLQEAQSQLPDALRREAATANKYRNLVFGFWSLAFLLAVVSCGFFYLKITYGGVFEASGKLISAVWDKHPEQAGNIELLLKQGLTPSQIKKVFGHSS